VTQAEIACETALSNSKLSKTDIREVFMAGGTSRVPATQRSVEKLFGKKPTVKNPDKAIALGASVYSSLKANPALLAPMQREAIKDANVADISPHFFGTKCLNSNTRQLENSIIIPKGEKLPCSITQSFYTVRDGQDAVDCSVTQSGIAETNPEFVSLIWEGNMEIERPGEAGREIQITYAYDLNGTMRCSFKDTVTSKSKQIDLKAS
jgi:molecular chaperone DnaK